MKNAEKRRLLETNYLGFFSLAMAILRDEQDACDAVQDAMVHVLTRGVIRKDVLAYTFQTVRNCAIDILRHRRRFVPLQSDVPDSGAALEARLRQVARLRDELPDSMRSLVELHDEEGYSQRDLAVMTGLSLSTVRRRIEEAHQILKNRIEQEI